MKKERKVQLEPLEYQEYEIEITLRDVINEIKTIPGLANFSERELACIIDMRQPTINDMSNNLSRRVTLDVLARLCQVLDCDISDILKLKKLDKPIKINRKYEMPKFVKKRR